MLKEKKRFPAAGFLLCFAVVFVLMGLLNQRTVYSSDDYMYHFFWEDGMPGETVRLIRGPGDLFLSLWNHYRGFNGRIVSHFFVMLFMRFDKWVFNLFNTLMYMLVGVLILSHIEGRPSRWRPGYLAAVYVGMWMFFPHFGLSVLWLAGACNYLWMSGVILLFLLPYRRYVDAPGGEGHLLGKSIGMALMGLLAGCTNENSGGAAILLALFLTGYGIYEKKKAPVWSAAGILGACAGLGVLLAAPSSRGRMEQDAFVWSDYLKRIREIVGFSYHYVLPLLVLLTVLVYLLWKEKRRAKEAWLPLLYLPGCYCVAGAASVLVLILSPVISGKSWIWADCYLMIAAGTVAGELKKMKYRRKPWQSTAILLFCCWAAVWYGVVWNNLNRTYQETRQQVRMMEEAKEKGILDVSVPMLTWVENTYNAVYHEPQLSEDKEDWFNQWMARYYGMDSITGIPGEKEERP